MLRIGKSQYIHNMVTSTKDGFFRITKILSSTKDSSFQDYKNPLIYKR